MVVAINLRNTFVVVEPKEPISSDKKRSRSVDIRSECSEAQVQMQHLEELWTGARKLTPVAMDDVQVIQTDCCEDIMPTKPIPLGKLGKMRPISSVSSVSTMASDEDSSDSRFASSNSLSSMVSWCDEEDMLSSDDCSQHIQQVTVQATPKDSRHGLVPKNVNLAEEYAKATKDGQAITTLMIRNIPNRCSQRELIGELEKAGFAGCFDFVYVPLDLGTMSNVGYAFVNFIHSSYAVRCMELLPRIQFSRQRKSGKPVAVSPAHMQGLEANLRHYEKSAVNTSRLRQRRPVVMNVLKTVTLANLL